MRLALGDIKKTFSHRGDTVYVIPRLLRPRELLPALDALIALYESFVGRERADFPPERAAELIGDYRLARCLVTCLGEWYEWRTVPWPAAASEGEAAALREQGIASPGALRLALYDDVNTQAGGYLPSESREAGLNRFAGTVGITRATLDLLLELDAESHGVLARLTPNAPTAVELARRYNQRAVEAMLANASTVEWTLLPESAAGSGSGLGTLVKQTCFLARHMGVQYDVAFDGVDVAAGTLDEAMVNEPPQLALVAETPTRYVATPGDAAPTTTTTIDALDRAGRPLVVTLYGPQEVTGAPMQYGERLASLCRALLGYRRRDDAEGRAALAGGGLSGEAVVYVRGRPMHFAMDERLLRLLRGATRDEAAETSDPAFDSSLEARLYAEFAALERADQTAGWRLEREPEPILVEDTILVPDFALTRGPRRVYLEIAGYWRPEYRDRKARKLAKLRGRVDLVLAAPESARSAFEPLGQSMPLLWYKDRVRAHALLSLLEREYDDAAQRLASLDPAAIVREVGVRGCVPPAEAMALLRCYSRNELAQAVALLERQASAAGDTGPVWIDGIGLSSVSWRDALLVWLRAEVEKAPDDALPLESLRGALAAYAPALSRVSEAEVESLAGLAGLPVTRPSIFEATVSVAGTGLAAETNRQARDNTPAQKARPAQPRRSASRRQSGTTTETRPLFAEVDRAGDADATPAPPLRPIL